MCRAMCNFKRRETDRIVGTSSVKMCTRKRARPQSTQFATAICEYTYFSFFFRHKSFVTNDAQKRREKNIYK